MSSFTPIASETSSGSCPPPSRAASVLWRPFSSSWTPPQATRVFADDGSRRGARRPQERNAEHNTAGRRARPTPLRGWDRGSASTSVATRIQPGSGSLHGGLPSAAGAERVVTLLRLLVARRGPHTVSRFAPFALALPGRRVDRHFVEPSGSACMTVPPRAVKVRPWPCDAQPAMGTPPTSATASRSHPRTRSPAWTPSPPTPAPRTPRRPQPPRLRFR